MASKMKVNKSYISPIDKSLAEFNRTHPKSASQWAEIMKYERVYRLRDNAVSEPPAQSIWDQFQD